ncbi:MULTISPECIES: hypothetical protein [Pantoea]|uniref:hypothetical protein n=1 Tax=Pantoea TaxID=53335 RepID=UPI0006D00E05|nr:MULTISPECIES: hypothetical protein [Pantoea]MDN4127232.1 hypothetical protein [Pantoea ananatis]MDN4150903.1 hypothetical protein [Pantoea ananatis]
MADYIRKDILSQSYVHVEPEWLISASQQEKEKTLSEIIRKITSFSDERIRFFLDDKVDIEIKFEDGSIRAWITAYGPILLLIGSTITNYSSFRESIKYLVADSQRVANMVNTEIIFQSKSRSRDEILRVESRKGVIGSIERINNKIDAISGKLKRGDCSPTLINEDFLELNGLILELFSNVNDKNDAKLIASALHDGVDNFNIKKGRFKLSDQIDQYMLTSLTNEKKLILKNLDAYR